MSRRIVLNDTVFEAESEMIDVTSLHRPDTNWSHTDPAGHVHRWFMDGKPAMRYDPSARYDVPSLEQVTDPEIAYVDDDGQPHYCSHWECRLCRAHVVPGHRADDNQQYMAGITTYRVNGKTVSKDEFQRQYDEARRIVEDGGH